MNSFVTHQVGLLDESTATDLAHVGPYGHVRAEMGGQLGLLGRRVLATRWKF